MTKLIRDYLLINLHLKWNAIIFIIWLIKQNVKNNNRSKLNQKHSWAKDCVWNKIKFSIPLWQRSKYNIHFHFFKVFSCVRMNFYLTRVFLCKLHYITTLHSKKISTLIFNSLIPISHSHAIINMDIDFHKRLSECSKQALKEYKTWWGKGTIRNCAWNDDLTLLPNGICTSPVVSLVGWFVLRCINPFWVI